MVKCPQCGTDVPAPTKAWSLLREPDKVGGILEQKVGIYECSKCRTRFPYAFGSQKLKLVSAEKLQQLVSALADAKNKSVKLEQKVSELEGRKTALETDIKQLEERMTINELQARASALEREVAYLQQDKRGLEEEIARYN